MFISFTGAKPGTEEGQTEELNDISDSRRTDREMACSDKTAQKDKIKWCRERKTKTRRPTWISCQPE